MDRNAWSVFFASAMGSLAMAAASFQLAHWLGWNVWVVAPAGFLIGGLVTWLCVDFAHARLTVVNAWHTSAPRTRTFAHHRGASYWKAVAADSTLFLTVGIWVGMVIGALILSAIFGGSSDASVHLRAAFGRVGFAEGSMILALPVLVTGLCVGAILCVFGFVASIVMLEKDRKVVNETQWQSQLQIEAWDSWRLAWYVSPPYVLGLLIMLPFIIVRTAPVWVPILDDALSYVFERFVQFLWLVIVLAHSSRLNVALVGTAIGGVTGIFYGNAFIGMIVGGLAGVGSYHFFGKSIMDARTQVARAP